jgi:hypothetical protein
VSTPVSDSDASVATDSVVTHPPYPFWLAVITVTGVDVLQADGTLLNGIFILTPSIPLYVPGAVIEGSATLTVTAGVATPIVIPCTDSVTPGFTYTITQRLATADNSALAPITGVLVPRTLGASVDISALL